MTHSRSGLACALALLFMLGCAVPTRADAADIIVRRDAGLKASERADIRSDAGVKLDRMLSLPDTEVVSAPEGEETSALAALNADPDVRFAVPDVAVHVADAPDIPGESGIIKPNDLFFDAQWNLANANDADIDAPQAWAHSSEGAGVTVAVADQVVDPNHPDLRDNIAPGAQDFTTANGCTEPTPTGLADHGTHVAGIIAAESNNQIGIAGVAPRSHVLPLRAIDNCGNGKTSWILAAFDYAGDHGIPIVSASFGTEPWLEVSEKADINNMFAEVLADHPDTLYVVAAGNEGNNNAENPIYPCNTRTRTDPENLICVGMTNANDVPVCSGNVGDGVVDVYAPGIGIWSTVGPSIYLKLSGTSMSTPMVAGAAAMLASRDLGAFSPPAIKEAVISTSDQIRFMTEGTGRLNAARMLEPDDDLGTGGPGPVAPWTTCDRDHDTQPDLADECPDQPGKLRGCPDSDNDLVRDSADNCPGIANADQADDDHDGAGNLCDHWPRGDDLDGDGVGALDDVCPTVPASTANGCLTVVIDDPGHTDDPTGDPLTVKPTPTPPPGTATRILALRAVVTPHSCPKARPKCSKAAKVTVKLSRRAIVALKLEMKVKRKGHWVWTRLTSKSVTATASGRSLVIRGKHGRSLAKGSYRMVASLSGSSAKTVFSFRV